MTAITPNLYQLHGPHLNISYALSGIDGKPHFSYHDTHHTLQFSGDQIRTVATEIGTLVTVTIQITVDSGSTSFTLLVPTVNLGKNHQAVHITTHGVTTLHKFSIVPALNQGQTELYTVTKLTGTAEFVVP
jgi:hypothetical protein